MERAECEKAAEARRKRVRRVNFEKEDRGRLRKVARSRDDGTRLPLEATPEGLRETAMHGSPRSAKEAGRKLRKLTQTFYERLRDPRFYGVTDEDLSNCVVKTQFWDGQDGQWATGTRLLKRYSGRFVSSDSHGYYVSSDWSESDAAVSNDVERIVMTCSIPG